MLNQVTEFHKTFGHPIGDGYTLPNVELRFKLIEEEFKETVEELAELHKEIDLNNSHMGGDYNTILRNLTKELADLIYVVHGTAVSLGLPLEEVFNRVHENNMSKVGEDGKPIRNEAGKILKPDNYQPVDLDDLFGL